MPNLRDIKQRIDSVQSTRQITRTMEMVATARIRKAQERIEAARPYALSMVEVLQNVARYVQGASHPLLEEHEERKRVVVVSITSDRGLAGAFNSNILRLTEDLMRREAADGVETDVIAVGKKAVGYLRYRVSSPAPRTRTSPTSPRSPMRAPSRRTSSPVTPMRRSMRRTSSSTASRTSPNRSPRSTSCSPSSSA
jgi:ATP synthase F1 subcomplex gamma subunit